MLFLLLISFLITPLNDEIASYFQSINKGNDIEIVNVKIPRGMDDFQINRSGEIKSFKDISFIPITGTRNNKVISSFAEVKINQYTQGLTALRDINPKEILQDNMFSISRVKISGSVKNPMTLENIKECRSRVFIRKGSVLFFKDVEQIPLIKQGSSTDAILTKGNISIGLKVTARKDGVFNEIIPVLTKDGIVYNAKVVSNDLVEIQL